MSLKEALTVESGPRTIVFNVGGLFDLKGTGMDMSGEEDSFVTLACQTAPSPGVTIKTFGLNIQSGTHDIIMRHCRIRAEDVGAPGSTAGRTFTIRGGAHNIMLDHMSLSWATDENFQVYTNPTETQPVENITLSNSIIAEGDADSSHPLSVKHPNWKYHSMGPSCNNNSTQEINGCSIVNNFIAHNSSRNAMIWGGSGELINNIVYNWYGVGVTAQPQSGSPVNAIIHNNLMKSGPDTEGGTSNPHCGKKDYRCALYLGPSNNEREVARYLIGDNYYIPEYMKLSDVILMDRHANANTPAGKPSFKTATPSPIDIRSMAAPDSDHMKCVGSSRPYRDPVDERIIKEFHTGTGTIGIGNDNRSGGHNVQIQRDYSFYPTKRHSADYDKDRDGMADEWEQKNGLNPNDSTDHSADRDGDGYTNIEEFLNYMAQC